MIKALDKCPRHFWNMTRNPTVFGYRNVHGEAVHSFKDASRYIQAGAHVYFRLGNSLFALDRFSEAEFAFKQALEVLHLSV
jgi:hypothetical protein